MTIIEIKKDIWKNLSKIPDWVDTKSPTHKRVWNIFEDCWQVMFILIIDRTLSDAAILKIFNKLEHFINELYDFIDDELIEIINLYIIGTIDYMILSCVEEELFEAAANLKKLSDLIWNKKSIDEYE